MKLTVRTVLEVGSHEAIIRQAYKDSVGVWTWSAGITSKSGHKVERYIDNPQPMAKCLEIWIWLLERYADDVRKVFAGHELSESQFAAALSFHWNTGSIKRASWVKHWKAGNVSKARKAFMNWSKPKEIIPRRKKERDLFFDGKWSNDGKITEYTRLTSRHTPVWGSAKRIDIREEVSELLYSGPGGNSGTEPPERGQGATNGGSSASGGGFWAALVAAFAALFGKRK